MKLFTMIFQSNLRKMEWVRYILSFDEKIKSFTIRRRPIYDVHRILSTSKIQRVSKTLGTYLLTFKFVLSFKDVFKTCMKVLKTSLLSLLKVKKKKKIQG